MNTDYKKPIAHHQSDYRTSASRAHRFVLSADRKFVPRNAHVLCNELNSSWSDYRPKSEASKEFQWKINPNRNFREEFAAPISRVQYLAQFTDKVKASDVIKPLDYYRSRSSDKPPFTALPKDLRLPAGIATDLQPIEHVWRETHYTDTPGYYPLLDSLVSTTELDFHRHKHYSQAQTNLIVQKEPPFNANVAYFIPKTKLIEEFPLCKKYSSKIVRDVAKFPTPDYDRITLMRTKCREMKSEMAANY